MKLILVLVSLLISCICALNVGGKSFIVRPSLARETRNVPTDVDKDFAHALEARAGFEATWVLEPYNKYITGVFVSTLEIENSTQNINLKDGELLTDFCLHVMLNVNLESSPYANLFPSEFSNFRVFYHLDASTILSPAASSAEQDVYVCPALAVQCADGSWSGLSGPNCEPSCPYVEEKPTGGITYNDISEISILFAIEFNQYLVSVTALQLQDLYDVEVPTLTENESMTDYCLDVQLNADGEAASLPNVYHGARVFFKSQSVCTQELRICADGSTALRYRNCTQFCSDEDYVDGGFLGTILICTSIVLISMCACCCRACNSRRRCRMQKNGFQRLEAQPVVHYPIEEDAYYPADQYNQYELSEQQMPPPMMMPMAPHMVPVGAPHPYMMPSHMMPPHMFNPSTHAQNENEMMMMMQQHPFYHPMFPPMIPTPHGFMMVPPPVPQQQENEVAHQ